MNRNRGNREGRNSGFVVSVLLLTLLSTATALAQKNESTPPPAESGWIAAPIEGAPVSYGHRWFTIDAFNEELHALYFHSTKDYKPNYLIYGYSPDKGKTWSFDTIDGTDGLMAHVDNLFSIAVFNAAIAVDRCGIPHVFYTVNYFYNDSRRPSWAIHAQKVDGKWIRDTVEARSSDQSMINFDVDMVIGSDNQPRVVYIHGEDEPMYGVRTNGLWKIEPVGGVGESGYYYASLALNKKNIPHIALSKLDGVEYATQIEGKWRVEHVISEGNGADIALDDSGRPHITYSQPLAHPFYHATLEEGKWQSTLMESNVIEGSENTKRARIKIDPEGTLHVVYYGHNDLPAPEYLVYASSTDNGATWKEELVEYAGDIYAETSYPDLVVTDSMIGVFYKGEGDMPHFAYKKRSKPGFRKSKPNNCGQENSQQRVRKELPMPGE